MPALRIVLGNLFSFIACALALMGAFLGVPAVAQPVDLDLTSAPIITHPTIEYVYKGQHRSLECYYISHPKDGEYHPTDMAVAGLQGSVEWMIDGANELYDYGHNVLIVPLSIHQLGSLNYDFGADEILFEEIPRAVDLGMKLAGGPLDAYIGHSLGGILGYQYMTGAHRGNGSVEHSEEVAWNRHLQIRHLITNSAPAGLRGIPFELKAISALTNGVVHKLNGRIPTLTSLISGGKYLSEDTAKKIRETLVSSSKELLAAAPNYLVNCDNLTDKELVHFFANSWMPFNFRLAQDFNRWNLKGHTSRDGASYNRPRSMFSDHLALFATQDRLAPPQQILSHLAAREKLREQAIQRGDARIPGRILAAGMKKTGHCDALVGKRAASMTAGIIDDVVRGKEIDAPVSQPLMLEAPSVCERAFSNRIKALTGHR